MPEQNPILDALETSVIIDRKDKPAQVPWTEWRVPVVTTSTSPPAVGSIPMTGANGKLDPSLITGGGGGSTVSVNGTLVANPNFNNALPIPPTGYTNVLWQFDGSGDVSAYIDTSGTFSLDDGTFLNPASDFMFDDGNF
jgi:hypothetical protein